ncbi:Hypothetical predicted protein, partial [Xyrichtys novacula]
PSPWLSRVRLGSRRDKHTKAISPATNGCVEKRASALFTSQIGGVIYIQRSEPVLLEGFRSAKCGTFTPLARKTKEV